MHTLQVDVSTENIVDFTNYRALTKDELEVLPEGTHLFLRVDSTLVRFATEMAKISGEDADGINRLWTRDMRKGIKAMGGAFLHPVVVVANRSNADSPYPSETEIASLSLYQRFQSLLGTLVLFEKSSDELAGDLFKPSLRGTIFDFRDGLFMIKR